MRQHSGKKRLGAVLLSLALCLSLLPTAALAAEGDNGTVYVGSKMLTGSAAAPAYATTNNEGVVTVLETQPAEESEWNVKWDGTTLTLNGATIKESANNGTNIQAAIYSGGDVRIALEGENTAERSGDIGNFYAYAIYATGDITFSGNGCLEATGYSGGIRTNDGDIAVQGGTIEAIGEGGNGIQSGGSITISGGTVEANIQGGGSASAIWAYGDITISGGEVTATATEGTGDYYRCGIRAYGDITISGGTVTATGVKAGIAAYKEDITISGDSKVTATGTHAGIGDGGGSVTISGSSCVTAQATGEEGYGIDVGPSVTISSTGTVTAIGGESCIEDDSTVTIAPQSGQQIAVTVSENTDGTGAEEIQGSPFYRETKIKDYINISNTSSGHGMKVAPYFQSKSSARIATVYVGGQELTSNNGSTVYATTDERGTVTTGGSQDSYNVKWDGDFLTLRNATIAQGTQETRKDAAIYSEDSLQIQLVGENEVTGAEDADGIQADGVALSGDGSLTAQGAVGIHAVKWDLVISCNTVTAESISQDSQGVKAGGYITVSPREDQQIAVVAGESAEKAQPIDDSPFDLSENIQYHVSDKKYFHSQVEERLFNIYVGAEELSGNANHPAYATTNGEGKVITDGADADNYNVKWDGTTLTLRDATIREIHEDAAIQTDIDHKAPLNIVLEGENTVDVNDEGGFFCISAYHGLAISGDGSLAVTVTAETDEYTLSAGIFSYENVTIAGGTVTATATGGTGEETLSAGIFSYENVTITGGTVMATATGEGSAGIAPYGDITITGGTVTATATGEGSAGIAPYGDITITGGTVTAAGEGRAVFLEYESTITIDPQGGWEIQAKAGDSEDAAAEITIPENGDVTESVSDAKYFYSEASASVIPVTGVTLSPSALNLEPGETASITATVTPETATDKTVIWTSSDEGVATVANGVVTAVSESSATITATAGGVSATCTVTVERPYTPPPYVPSTKPEGPTIGDADGWEDIQEELGNAETGDTITIDMGDETKVPGEIFEEVAGKDVTVEIDLGEVTWTVNGQDIPTGTDLSDLDLGVALGTDGISVDVINTVTGEYGSVQITLAHDGEFGFALTLTAPLGKENAGYWANLYHYDEENEVLLYETSAQIDEDGDAALRLTHASQYAIVIDHKSHEMAFTDVAAGDWFFDAVQYAYLHDLMNGVENNQFAPNATTNRAMVVTILYRLAGEPAVSGDSAFTDVADGLWYSNAVAWAAEKGVVNGISETEFSPAGDLTREQLATILYRYAESMGYDVSASADLSGFPDADQIQSYATEALSWAVAEGLLQGFEDDTLQPQSTATRAQIATILMRFCEGVGA